MKLTYKSSELLEKIPSDWSQITLGNYFKLMKVKVTDSEDPVDAMQTNLEIAKVFLDLDVEIIEQFPITLIKDINEKLRFLSEKPKPIKESKYEWIKDINDPSYDDFITFVKVSEQLEKGNLDNMALVIKVILKKKLTEEEILEMPMNEVEHGFFLLRRYLLKYLKSTTKDLTNKIIIMRMNEIMTEWKETKMPFKKKLKVSKEKYKELMAGISSQKK